MARRAILAVAAAVVLLGTVQVATRPDRGSRPVRVAPDYGVTAQTPGWVTMVQSGTSPRPVPMSASFDILFTGVSPWASLASLAYEGGGAGSSPRLRELGSPYTQIIVSPTGDVLSVCHQTELGWVPPCLLDGSTPVS
ncbi:MAG: hypothetical protein KJ548_06035 [Actinobacteria bacterium]|nr:hypothetical protein [Actinomycetota bacterium]MBU4336113.1 hypothetical protein [Actinomycetota bacterium]MCG2800942.1 hypothetical protein [Cellulomonas sp.]